MSSVLILTKTEKFLDIIVFIMAKSNALVEVCAMLDTYGGRDKVGKAKLFSDEFLRLLS